MPGGAPALATVESVDSWPLAILDARHPDADPPCESRLRRRRSRGPAIHLSAACRSPPAPARASPAGLCVRTGVEEPSGAIGWSSRSPGTPGASRWPGGTRHPDLETKLWPPSGGLGRRQPGARPGPPAPVEVRYLVDSASSHMLVSKIKPCMSKYKLFVL
ncbi:hypothetical protein N7470_010075 [Penicillium chermesinum]|nr:hypothetical protein N7470_010075 [Penicillium chermesinum]